MKNDIVSPKEVYGKYIVGDHISDREVVEGYTFYRRLANDLRRCGPVFHLAFKEANYISDRLFEIGFARKLEMSE